MRKQISKQEARQGDTPRVTRYVLGICLPLAVAVVGIAWLVA